MIVLANSHIGDNEYADYDLEAPINDVLIWKDNDYKEYYEGH